MEAASIEQKIDRALVKDMKLCYPLGNHTLPRTWQLVLYLCSASLSCVLSNFFFILLNLTMLLYIFLLAHFTIGYCSFAETLHLG